MEKIKTCRICNNKNIVEFLDLGEQPPANSLMKNIDDEEVFYPLSLSWCPECNLVQLNHTVDPKELFSNYVWVTSTSKTAREHSEVFYNDILSRTNNLEEGYVIEAASNDGTFLLPFVKNNYKVLGVDPAQNIVNIAVSKGVPTICRFFGTDTAEELLQNHGPAQVIIVRNVLSHVANLHDFVKGLNICLKEDGLLAIEFHYAKEIFEELHYDSIYHEHLCYFTLKSVENLLNRYNLFVNDIKESPISGGSLILYVKKEKGTVSPTVQRYRDIEKTIKINELRSWKDFATKVYSHRDQLLEILKDAIKTKGPIVGYGASARSSTLLNFCGIDSKYVTKIADQNTLKHKHYTAGTHIPIESPEDVMSEKPEYVFILAWNFTDEIINSLRENFDFNGKCILPLPNNPKIVNVRE
ncbi:MAG: class I SAM-dependent methyltransferase [Thermoplasmatales archaeon]|nr:class I SAM-dependent methyltransferase [Thermoplasmatales archaeon]